VSVCLCVFYADLLYSDLLSQYFYLRVKIKEPERARLKIKLQYPVDIFFCRQTTRKDERHLTNEKSEKVKFRVCARKPVFVVCPPSLVFSFLSEQTATRRQTTPPRRLSRTFFPSRHHRLIHPITKVQTHTNLRREREREKERKRWCGSSATTAAIR